MFSCDSGGLNAFGVGFNLPGGFTDFNDDIFFNILQVQQQLSGLQPSCGQATFGRSVAKGIAELNPEFPKKILGRE